MIFIRTLLQFLKDRQYRSLILASLTALVVGTVGYHFIEGWSWLDSLYFSTITLTTIGYGDLSPVTDLGKVFTIVYIIIGVGLILSFVNTIYSHFNRLGKTDQKGSK